MEDKIIYNETTNGNPGQIMSKLYDAGYWGVDDVMDNDFNSDKQYKLTVVVEKVLPEKGTEHAI